MLHITRFSSLARRLTPLFALLFTMGVTDARSAGQPASDRMQHPATLQQFLSPDGGFKLVIQAPDGWKPPFPTAQLFSFQGTQSTLRWTRVLPHHYGPRRALVSQDGHVLLIDEWTNVRSPVSLMLIDAKDRVVAIHEYAALLRAAGVSAAAVSEHARSGTWMGGEPALADGGRQVTVTIGGRTLVIALDDGGLSSRP